MNAHTHLFDLLETLERRSTMAGYRAVAFSLQNSLIRQADWMVRRRQQEERATALAEAHGLITPDLDLRNQQDATREFRATPPDQRERVPGFDPQETDEDRLCATMALYRSVVERINALKPNQYEVPQDLATAVANYKPQVGAALPNLAPAEMEPGEMADAVVVQTARQMAEYHQRLPEVYQTLVEYFDQAPEYAPNAAPIETMPPLQHLRLALSAYRGIYAARKQLVQRLASRGRLDDLGEIRSMQADLETVEAWARAFEHAHREVFDALIEVGVDVPSIDDAKAQAQQRWQQRVKQANATALPAQVQ